MPAIGFETRGTVFSESQISGAIYRDVIIVVKINDSSETQMSRQRRGFGGDAFHQVTIGDNSVYERIDQVKFRFVEQRGEMRLSNGHANTLTKPLAQRTGRHFHTGSKSVFRVTGSDASKLPEVFDIVEAHVISRQMKERVKEHRSMPTRKDEAVASHPPGVARIMSQVARPQGVSHRSGSHGKAGMSRVGLLDGIR